MSEIKSVASSVLGIELETSPDAQCDAPTLEGDQEHPTASAEDFVAVVIDACIIAVEAENNLAAESDASSSGLLGLARPPSPLCESESNPSISIPPDVSAEGHRGEEKTLTDSKRRSLNSFPGPPARPLPSIPLTPSHGASSSVSETPIAISVDGDISSAAHVKTSLPRNIQPSTVQNESPGPFKKFATRFPSILIWLRPWKNPLIKAPITFIFTTLNAIFFLQLCFGGFGKYSNWEDCIKDTAVPCLSSRCKVESQYSFWYAEPSYHSSADDLPCSPLRQAAVSLSSRFPRASYKFAQDPSLSRSTLAVCTNASLTELDRFFMTPLESSILFTSKFFSGSSKISLPVVGLSMSIDDYYENTPYKMQDMKYQIQNGMGPWQSNANSSYYDPAAPTDSVWNS
jgi:hypothetical protein